MEAKKNIVVAEDDKSLWELLRYCLELENYQTLFFENGLEAKAYLSDNTPDLVVLDVLMPEINGLELCKWLKENKSGFIPVLLLTSNDKFLDASQGLDAGADDYLKKPFKIEELRSRANALVRIKALTDNLSDLREELLEKEREIARLQVIGATNHCLGQPLTALMLNCSMLEKFKLENKELENITSEICSLVKSMSQIINQFKKTNGFKLKPYVRSSQILDLDLPEID